MTRTALAALLAALVLTTFAPPATATIHHPVKPLVVHDVTAIWQNTLPTPENTLITPDSPPGSVYAYPWYGAPRHLDPAIYPARRWSYITVFTPRGWSLYRVTVYYRGDVLLPRRHYEAGVHERDGFPAFYQARKMAAWWRHDQRRRG